MRYAIRMQGPLVCPTIVRMPLRFPSRSSPGTRIRFRYVRSDDVKQAKQYEKQARLALDVKHLPARLPESAGKDIDGQVQPYRQDPYNAKLVPHQDTHK